jgi:hypothetical protein
MSSTSETSFLFVSPLGNTSEKSSANSNFMDRDTLRGDLQAVVRLLHLWASYPYLVVQAIDSEKITAKELFQLARAIVDAKDTIVVKMFETIVADK